MFEGIAFFKLETSSGLFRDIHALQRLSRLTIHARLWRNGDLVPLRELTSLRHLVFVGPIMTFGVRPQLAALEVPWQSIARATTLTQLDVFGMGHCPEMYAYLARMPQLTGLGFGTTGQTD